MKIIKLNENKNDNKYKINIESNVCKIENINSNIRRDIVVGIIVDNLPETIKDKICYLAHNFQINMKFNTPLDIGNLIRNGKTILELYAVDYDQFGSVGPSYIENIRIDRFHSSLGDLIGEDDNNFYHLYNELNKIFDLKDLAAQLTIKYPDLYHFNIPDSYKNKFKPHSKFDINKFRRN